MSSYTKGNQTDLMLAETPEETDRLIKSGADIDARDDDGQTALMFAESEAQTRILILAGANVNIKDNYGETAFHHARTESQRKLLIEAKTTVNYEDSIVIKTKSFEQKKRIQELINVSKMSPEESVTISFEICNGVIVVVN